MQLFSHPDYHQHERVIFHEDQKSGLKAIIAIHNRNLGPAIGGCRMLPYACDSDALTDVLRLSKGMTYKCAMGRIPFGGGKSVIIGDPNSDKTEALLHAMGNFVESLNGDYITSFDSGTTLDDIKTISTRTDHVGGISEGFDNASISTAYGVFTSIQAAVKYRLNSDSLSGVKVAVQGLGNVGLRLVNYLKEAGADIYATDINDKHLQSVADEFNLKQVKPDEIYSLDVDVFSPCALGAVINDTSLPQLNAAVIAGGANNQLLTAEHGEQLRKREILYAPDYVVNGGGIIELHYQLNKDDIGGNIEEKIKNHLDGIGDMLTEIFQQAEDKKQSTVIIADKIAEQRILSF